MDDDFSVSVETGLGFSQRICYGKDQPAPTPQPRMEKSPSVPPNHSPQAPMVYAVIHDPEIVDNPDIPSYQPHVHGRCDPPALIPLHMTEIGMNVDCYLNTAFVSVRGSWRVHCVMASRRCNCRLVVPMGEQVLSRVVVFFFSFQNFIFRRGREGCRGVSHRCGPSFIAIPLPGYVNAGGSNLGKGFRLQNWHLGKNSNCISPFMTLDHGSPSGSILGVEVDVEGRSYSTQIMQVEETQDMENLAKDEHGSVLSIKVGWSLRLLCIDGQFALSVPFTFPHYVTAPGKRLASERIQLNVNTGIDKEVVVKTSSHPMEASAN
ncbi:hypothetical protein ACLOJK_025187 [Asimina triloba]